MNILEIAEKYAISAGYKDTDVGRKFNSKSIEAFAAEITAQDKARIAELEDALLMIANKDNYIMDYWDIAQGALFNKSNWLELHDRQVRKQERKQVIQEVAELLQDGEDAYTALHNVANKEAV